MKSSDDGREKSSFSRRRGREKFSSPSLLILSLLLMGLLLLKCSCVPDRHDDCEFPLRLKFSYTFNREDRDLLRDEIDFLRLFLYDSSSGRLAAMREVEITGLDEDNAIEWKVPSGRHTLVAWGFSRDGAKPCRFKIDRADEGLFLHSLSLQSDMLTDEDNIKGVLQSEQHLWHGCRTDIIINGDNSPLHEIELRKISNDVNVNVYIGGVTPDPRTRCRIAATDGRYNALGQVTATTPTLYLPASEAIPPLSGFDVAQRHSFTILGLWASDDSNLELDIAGLDSPVYDGSLTELIDRLPYLDYTLDDVFNLDFFIRKEDDGTLGVSVRINDWDCINYNVSLK